MRSRLILVTLLLFLLPAPGCKKIVALDTKPLDQAGMWFESIKELRGMEVTQAEIGQLARAREAGISDAGCIELLKLARGRQQPFADGEAVASLRRAGVSEPTILELARINQLSSWSGEAMAMRLAGMPDNLLLAVAQRRAIGQSVPSGASLSRLKSTGLADAQLLELVNRGTTDAQAEEIVAARQRAAAPQGFVRYPRRRRR
jgi:hypothetical protein